jgi:hypothetical protein
MVSSRTKKNPALGDFKRRAAVNRAAAGIDRLLHFISRFIVMVARAKVMRP